MRKPSALELLTLIFTAIGSIVVVLVWFGINPYPPKPDLEVDLDMKPYGRFEGQDLHTDYRPASEDFENTLIFSISNVGNLYAKDVNVHLQYEPHSTWLNLESVSEPVKNNDLSNVTLPIIGINNSLELQYKVIFSPSEYDKLVAAGVTPFIYYNVTAANTDEKFNKQYVIRIP